MSDCRFPKPYEVWRLRFFFEDKPDIAKERPVVVLDRNEETGQVLVAGAKVTSHAPRPDFPGEVSVPRNRLNLPVPFPFFRAVQPRNGGHLFALLARAWRRTVVSIPRRVVSPSRQSLGRVRYTSFGALSLYGDLRWHSLQPSFIRRTRTSAKLNSIIRVLLYGSIRDPVKYSILFYKCFRDLFSRFFLLC